MSSDFVPRLLRQFKNKSHVWFKPQTFVNANSTKVPSKVSFTVGAEAANVINVAIQLQGADDVDIDGKAAVQMYLSSDSAGVTIEGSGPDSWAIGTDGIFIANGGDSLISGLLVSEADGDIDMNLTHAGADTFYMNVITPDGAVHTSGAITFDATT